MKPDVDKLLEVSAVALMTRLGPALPIPYDQSSATAMGVMLLALREEFERAAARRVAENAELRRLFREAEPAVADADLAARLAEGAGGADADLSVSALEHSNAALRALLIELHAHVEELDTPEAQRLDEAIWRELAASTERRRLSFALF